MTRKILVPQIISVLQKENYQIFPHGVFFRALSNSKDDLLLCIRCRHFSANESLMTSITRDRIHFLELESKRLGCIPCLAFGIATNNFANVEIYIAPIDVWLKDAETGGTVSVASGGFYFNQIHSSERLPLGTIVHFKS